MRRHQGASSLCGGDGAGGPDGRRAADSDPADGQDGEGRGGAGRRCRGRPAGAQCFRRPGFVQGVPGRQEAGLGRQRGGVPGPARGAIISPWPAAGRDQRQAGRSLQLCGPAVLRQSQGSGGLSGGHAADGEGRVAARSALWEVAGGAARRRQPEEPEGPGSSEGVESLRKQAAALLWQSAQSGKLFEVLEEAKGSPLEEPPQAPPEKQAAPEPPEAPAELGQQLAALEEPPRAPQEVDPVAPAEGAPELKAEHSDLRLAAREALMQGVQSGKLEQVLATKLQKGSAPSALNELEALREQARQALLEGAQSGQLLEILKDKERKDKSKEVDETEALRQEARAALLEGVQSGRLVELLSKKEPEKEPEDVELLRQQARVALLEGAQSGKLFEVLNQKEIPTQTTWR
ncbi:unnamed protein product [Effrenium voratum]|nr:unnamed protein product [Effrenium voratum]